MCGVLPYPANLDARNNLGLVLVYRGCADDGLVQFEKVSSASGLQRTPNRLHDEPNVARPSGRAGAEAVPTCLLSRHTCSHPNAGIR